MLCFELQQERLICLVISKCQTQKPPSSIGHDELYPRTNNLCGDRLIVHCKRHRCSLL